jgi:hypothetical protein
MKQKTLIQEVTDVTMEPQVEVTLEVKRRGRPIVEGSNRQNRIADLENRRANGTLKLGRPKMTPEQREEAKRTRELFQQFIKGQG